MRPRLHPECRQKECFSNPCHVQLLCLWRHRGCTHFEQGITLMQIAIPSTNEAVAELTALYSTERTFTAAKYEEAVWDRLLPGDAESYRYHLAFEMAKVEGFKTGYVAVKRSGMVVCLVPYFVTDYSLDSTVQGTLKRGSNWLKNYAPGLFNKLFKLKLLCVGSAV